MPKLNATHLPARIQDAIEKLERGEEVEAKKDKTLLTDEQRKALDDAWAIQQALRKTHKPPKTEEEKQRIGWKTIREVRIEIYKQALAGLEENIFDIHRKQLEKERANAAKAYLDGYFGATKEQNKDSAGRIAMTRAGFCGQSRSNISKRDKEVWALEEELKKRFEADASNKEKKQFEASRQNEDVVKK